MDQKRSVLVVGRGIVGLAIAYELCRHGWQVQVVGPRERLGTASHAAIGVSSLKGHILPSQPLFQAKLKGHEYLPEWLKGIEDDSGRSIAKLATGVVEPFFDQAQFAYMSERVFHGRFRGCLRAYLEGPSKRCDWLPENPYRQTPRGAFVYPGDLWFDPIQTLAALEEAIKRLGGNLRDGVVSAVIPHANAKLEVHGEQEQHDQSTPKKEWILRADEVVVAAGAFSTEILKNSGLPSMSLQLSPGETAYMPTSLLRTLNHRVGKTNYVMYEGYLRWGSTSRSVVDLARELDLGPSSQAISTLWEEASTLLQLPNLRPESFCVRWGIRTRVRDRAPVVGPLFWPNLGQKKVWVALGFYKNGLQLAGLLAKFLAASMGGVSSTSVQNMLGPLVSPSRRLS